MSRIYLREIERSDLPTMNSWRADPAISQHLGSPFRHIALGVDERWYEQYLASRANNVRLAICIEGGAMVGAAYLLGIDWINRDVEFAIWIGDRNSQGKRIGETGTRLALAHAFDDLNLQRVHLTVLTENERAIGLYRMIGFVEEGVQRRAVFKQGRYSDLLMMAMLRDQYVSAASGSADG